MPSLLQIGSVFARYANLTLGGGSATAATMHRELVEKRHWLTDDQFTLCFALGRITPGTNLLAFCTGFGWVLRGASGAVVALLASSIPCAMLVAVLTALFSYWQDSPFAQAAIHGAVAAAVPMQAHRVRLDQLEQGNAARSHAGEVEAAPRRALEAMTSRRSPRARQDPRRES
jgi:chromate transporter